jgi:hypothetical protein
MKISKWYLLLLTIPIAFLVVFAVVRSKEGDINKTPPVERQEKQGRPERPGRLAGEVKSVDLKNKTIEVQTDSGDILLYIDDRTGIRIREKGIRGRGPDALESLKKGMSVEVRYKEIEGKKVAMRIRVVDEGKLDKKSSRGQGGR